MSGNTAKLITMRSRLSQLVPPVTPAMRLMRHSNDNSDADLESLVTLKTLMRHQLHLGHHPKQQHPNMLPYIHGERHGIHIIQLEHTLAHLRRAMQFASHVAYEGGNVVFVGSRPSLHRLTVEAAQAAQAFYVLRWLPGTITNKERVLRRSVGYDPSKILQEHFVDPLEGIIPHSSPSSNATTVFKRQPYVHKPDLLVLLDYPNNSVAAHEANLARIPVIAICDTDMDPTLVQYPVPANDDSIAGVKLIANVLAKAVRNGKREANSRDSQ